MNEFELATWACPTCKTTTAQPTVCLEVAHMCRTGESSARARQVRMVRAA